jgi:hypothetical protein
MVCFNPYFRISVLDCLAHPYFSKIRKPENEDVSGLKLIDIDIDKIEGEISKPILHQFLLTYISIFKTKRSI